MRLGSVTLIARPATTRYEVGGVPAGCTYDSVEPPTAVPTDARTTWWPTPYIRTFRRTSLLPLCRQAATFMKSLHRPRGGRIGQRVRPRQWRSRRRTGSRGNMRLLGQPSPSLSRRPQGPSGQTAPAATPAPSPGPATGRCTRRRQSRFSGLAAIGNAIQGSVRAVQKHVVRAANAVRTNPAAYVRACALGAGEGAAYGAEAAVATGGLPALQSLRPQQRDAGWVSPSNQLVTLSGNKVGRSLTAGSLILEDLLLLPLVP
jgi:hypothetical protein